MCKGPGYRCQYSCSLGFDKNACALYNKGIGVSTLARWEAQFRDNDGDIPIIGSGSYASDEAKEIARLKRELRDAQDALDVLKKAIGILEKD